MIEAPFSTVVQIRFKDLDAMGHVNHATYITYLEQARVVYWWDRFGPGSAFDIIIGQVTIRYIKAVELADQQVEVIMGCSRLGNKSFDLVYEIRDAQDPSILFGRAKTSQVGFDYKAQQSMPLAGKFRETMERDQWNPAWEKDL